MYSVQRPTTSCCDDCKTWRKEGTSCPSSLPPVAEAARNLTTARKGKKKKEKKRGFSLLLLSFTRLSLLLLSSRLSCSSSLGDFSLSQPSASHFFVPLFPHISTAHILSPAKWDTQAKERKESCHHHHASHDGTQDQDQEQHNNYKRKNFAFRFFLIQ